MYEAIKLQIKIRGQYALLHTPFQGSFINPKPLTTHRHSNYHGPTMSFLPSTLLQDSPGDPAGVSVASALTAWISAHHLLTTPQPLFPTTLSIATPCLDLPWASWIPKVGLIITNVLSLPCCLSSARFSQWSIFFHSSKCSAKNQRSTSLNS